MIPRGSGALRTVEQVDHMTCLGEEKPALNGQTRQYRKYRQQRQDAHAVLHQQSH